MCGEKKNICTLIHGRLLRSIREGGFISTSVHCTGDDTHSAFPRSENKKVGFVHSNTWESDAVVTFHFRAQEAFCSYRQEKQGGKRRGRKEGGETYWSRQPHQKKRKSTLFLPHKLDRYCKCTLRLRKKYSLPHEGEKKSKLSSFWLHLMSSR